MNNIRWFYLGYCSAYGYSLIELIVVLAITAIVAIMAVPAATQGMLRIGVENAAGQLIAISSLAHTEALRRGYGLSLCGVSLDNNRNFSDCTGNTNWSNGILLFQDLNLDGSYSSSANERIKFIGFESGLTVSSSNALIAFNANDNSNSSTLVCIGKSYAGLGKYYSIQVSINNYGATAVCTQSANANCTGC